MKLQRYVNSDFGLIEGEVCLSEDVEKLELENDMLAGIFKIRNEQYDKLEQQNIAMLKALNEVFNSVGEGEIEDIVRPFVTLKGE